MSNPVLEVVHRDALVRRVDKLRRDLSVHRLHGEEAVCDRAVRLPQIVAVREPGARDGAERCAGLQLLDVRVERVPERRRDGRPRPSDRLEPLDLVVALAYRRTDRAARRQRGSARAGDGSRRRPRRGRNLRSACRRPRSLSGRESARAAARRARRAAGGPRSHGRWRPLPAALPRAPPPGSRVLGDQPRRVECSKRGLCTSPP